MSPPAARGAAFRLGTLAWFPFLILFLTVPSEIFLSNKTEFGFDATVMLPFAAVAGVMLALTIAAAKLFGGAGRWSAALFYIGCFLVLKDIFAPMAWGVIDGADRLTEPRHLTIIEAAIALAVIGTAVLVPLTVACKIGPVVVLAFAAAQFGTFALGLPHGPAPLARAKAPPAGAPAPHPNIYHVVFDAYSSLVFQPTVEKAGLADTFAGFTFYRNNLSNYVVTGASVPSFLTGTTYDGGSFTAWQEGGRTSGLRKALRGAGYRVELYVPDRARFWSFSAADEIHTSRRIALDAFAGSDAFRLVQVSLVRVAPNPLRRNVFKLSEAVLGGAISLLNGKSGPVGVMGFEFYKGISVPLFERFLAAERSRGATGRYVYLHVVLPHPPFYWGADCRFSGKTDFMAQTRCANRLMARMVGELKRLGRFDGSAIVVQSDHGFHGEAGGDIPDAFAAPGPVRASIRAAHKFFSVDGVLRRAHALLLVKPSGAAAAPMRVSAAPTQLLDVPATIHAAAALGIAAPEGASVLTLDEAAPRERHLYTGFYTRNAAGKTRVLGATLARATLSHVSYVNGLGWRVHDGLDAEAD